MQASTPHSSIPIKLPSLEKIWARWKSQPVDSIRLRRPRKENSRNHCIAGLRHETISFSFRSKEMISDTGNL